MQASRRRGLGTGLLALGLFVLAPGWSAGAAPPSSAPPTVRPFTVVGDGTVRYGDPVAAMPMGGVAGTSPPACGLETAAAHGQPVDLGTLAPGAFFNSATLSGGQIAFRADIAGSDRNQGIFRASGGVITPVAIGCGGGGGSGDLGNGSGDPTPIGGTFAGFFGGTFYVPAINAAGDVLFLADVDGGSAPRGLFLARGDGRIDVVATVGGEAPGGTIFAEVGHGTVNDAGVVAFAARAVGAISTGIYRWDNGVVTPVALSGDPAPGGGTFVLLVSETLGFADGTSVPGGPLPDIDNLGRIVCRPIVSGGPVSRGLVLFDGGNASWIVTAGEPAAGGGTFFDMQAAAINDDGEVAFFADINLGGGMFTSAWFAGTAGNLKRILGFGDVFDGGTVQGLAFSRNPMQTIDAAGRVVLWCNVALEGGLSRDRIAVVTPNSSVATVAQQGEAAAPGGTIGAMDSWPSIEFNVGATVSSGTPGAPNGVLSAHMLALDCSSCPADLDGSGGVDGADLGALLAAWGGTGPADLDQSGDVDGADLGALLAAWGPCE